MVSPSDLSPLLQPASIAVVGASQRERSLGRKVLRNLRESGYGGTVYAVHPTNTRVEGVACSPSIDELPDAPDCVVVCLPKPATAPTLESAAARGAKAAVVFASGFEETASGQADATALAEVCTRQGLVLCGPNCLGAMNVTMGAAMYSAAVPASLERGSVGLVSQSGSGSIALTAAGRFGFSYVISSGNEACTTLDRYVEYLADDDDTRVIALIVESVRDPGGFARAAELARERGKPIVALKLGRSAKGRSAAQSHTGGLMGGYEGYRAFFDRHGAIAVDDLDELIETTALLTRVRRLPVGGRLGVVTVSGGEASLICDVAERLGVPLADLTESTATELAAILPPFASASNPLDVGGLGFAEPARHEACLKLVAADPGVDVVLVAHDAPVGMSDQQALAYRDVMAVLPTVADASDKPVVHLSNLAGALHPIIDELLDDAGVASLRGTRAGLAAIAKLVEHASWRGQQPSRTATIPARDTAPRDVLPAGAGGLLGFDDTRRLLGAYDLQLPDGEVAESPEDAGRLADKLGYPVVVKAVSPGLVHKTDVGGVRLDLVCRSEVEQAAYEMSSQMRSTLGEQGTLAFLVQQQVSGVAEAIVGLKDEPPFGLMLMAGPGGTLVDLFASQVAVALPPLTADDAAALLARTPLVRLLSGLRGGPVGDTPALVELIVNVSRMAQELTGRVAEVDLNPVAVLPEGRGAVVLDAKVLVAETPSHPIDGAAGPRS